jgi:predicted glycosyltransferase involved in capsule biosynthesis
MMKILFLMAKCVFLSVTEFSKVLKIIKIIKVIKVIKELCKLV